jgi:hypothetical protein
MVSTTNHRVTWLIHEVGGLDEMRIKMRMAPQPQVGGGALVRTWLSTNKCIVI